MPPSTSSTLAHRRAPPDRKPTSSSMTTSTTTTPRSPQQRSPQHRSPQRSPLRSALRPLQATSPRLRPPAPLTLSIPPSPKRSTTSSLLHRSAPSTPRAQRAPTPRAATSRLLPSRAPTPRPAPTPRSATARPAPRRPQSPPRSPALRRPQSPPRSTPPRRNPFAATTASTSSTSTSPSAASPFSNTASKPTLKTTTKATVTTTTATTSTTSAHSSPRLHSRPQSRQTPLSSQRPRTQKQRLSTGPLSSRTMAQIRCPTRVDFINAVNNGLRPAGPDPRSPRRRARRPEKSPNSPVALQSTPLRTSQLTDDDSDPNEPPNQPHSPVPAALPSPSTPSDHHPPLHPAARPAPHSPSASCPALTTTATATAANAITHSHGVCTDSSNPLREASKDDDDSDDEGVPSHLNRRVLDALDRVGECDELRALVRWMDTVRNRAGFTIRLTDVDLANGVAMLQTLSTVAPEAFASRINADASNPVAEGGAKPGDSVQRSSGAAVDTNPCLELDEIDEASRNNLDRVRAALHRFEWRDGPNGQRVDAVAFERVDTWALAGFVAVAAVTGSRASDAVDEMLRLDDWVQERLTDVVSRGLAAMGVEVEATATAAADGGNAYDSGHERGSLLGERRRRVQAERELARVRDEARAWREKAERLEAVLRSEREQAAAHAGRLEMLLQAERRRGEEARAEARGRRRRVLADSKNGGSSGGGIGSHVVNGGSGGGNTATVMAALAAKVRDGRRGA